MEYYQLFPHYQIYKYFIFSNEFIFQIFYHTVIKSASTEGNKIQSITGNNNCIMIYFEAIQRTPQPGVQCNGYDILLSEDIEDWYSPKDSPRWTKDILQFSSSSSQK